MGQWRKILQPKTSGFLHRITEVKRLDDLIWGTDVLGQNSDRIFQSNPFDGRSEQFADKCYRFTLQMRFAFEPSCPGCSKVSARRMSNHQVPTLIQMSQNIVLNMLARSFCRQQVAGPRIVPQRGKGIADNPAEFAGNQNFHLNRMVMGNSDGLRCASYSRSSWFLLYRYVRFLTVTSPSETQTTFLRSARLAALARRQSEHCQ